MKKVSKATNIVSLAVIITLIFLCAINITYAYFSATKYVAGQTAFSDFNVNFRYKNSNTYVAVEETELDIYPVNEYVEVGTAIDLKLSDNTPISLIGFELGENSTTAYIRFWIDAYVYENDVQQTENYGKYFEFVNLNASNFSTSSKTVSGQVNTIYYYDKILTGGIDVASQISLSLDAPTDLFGKSLKISICFDAVQSQNEAFKTVFDDEKGYSSAWS